MQLEKHKNDWEDLSRLDPYWAILTDSRRQFGRWDPDEFFATGEEEIQTLLATVASAGFPLQTGSVLDFGCGVGRLTRALGRHFNQCTGVDISEIMIDRARDLNRQWPNCRFLVNTEGNLKCFSDNQFDFIYSNNVLQHLPNKTIVKSYLEEFLRVLKPTGLLVFQLPSDIPFLLRLQPRRKLYLLLRAVGFSEKLLYEKLRLDPMQMKCVPETEVLRFLESRQARVLKVVPSLLDTPLRRPIENRLYLVAK